MASFSALATRRATAPLLAVVEYIAVIARLRLGADNRNNSKPSARRARE
jgi:hypothetical protein